MSAALGRTQGMMVHKPGCANHHVVLDCKCGQNCHCTTCKWGSGTHPCACDRERMSGDSR